MTKASALIPAAGVGARLGKGINKALVEVAGKPILAHTPCVSGSELSGNPETQLARQPILAYTLSVFEACEAIGEIIIVTGEQDIEAAGEIVGRFGFAKVKHIIAGGAERQDSVRNGLAKAAFDVVVIHDAARPMVTTEMIERSIAKAEEMGACIAAVPVIDTIKSASDGIVGSTVDRSSLYSVQTPQTFRTDLIRRAYDQAYADGFYATDDAALVEHLGEKVAIVQGSYENIKITTPSDLEIAECRLGTARHPELDSGPEPGRHPELDSGPTSASLMPHSKPEHPELVEGRVGAEIRTGFGFDVHALVEGRELWLGGVKIEHERGLLGHSDADVLLHAIADACLGAAALGDIGKHFPDSDPTYKGISSLKLLAHVGDLLKAEGYSVLNVDAVVACERPKIAPHASLMRNRIAGALSTTDNRISIKGTTTEGLGYTGRGEGIASWAVATLRKV